MRIQSKRSLWAALAFSALASASLVTACDKSSSAPQSKCMTQGATAEISGNHGHAIDIPADAIKRGMGGTYAVKGGDHEHAIVLKDADMKTLQSGTPVKTRTSSVNGHVHEVEVKCKE
jgi:hypothetical protein